MVNTVLCSALAEAFNNFSASIEKGQAPLAVAQATLKDTNYLRLTQTQAPTPTPTPTLALTPTPTLP